MLVVKRCYNKEKYPYKKDAYFIFENMTKIKKTFAFPDDDFETLEIFKNKKLVARGKIGKYENGVNKLFIERLED